jgi:hypothetical protein
MRAEGCTLTPLVEERHGPADLEWVDPNHHPFESFFGAQA